MAKKIDVPFTDTDVSASTDGVKDAGKLAAGFSVLTVAGAVGVFVGNRAMQMGSEAAGIENPSDNGMSVKF